MSNINFLEVRGLERYRVSGVANHQLFEVKPIEEIEAEERRAAQTGLQVRRSPRSIQVIGIHTEGKATEVYFDFPARYSPDGQRQLLVEDLDTVMTEGRIGNLGVVSYQDPQQLMGELVGKQVPSKVPREADPAISPVHEQWSIRRLRGDVPYSVRVNAVESVTVLRGRLMAIWGGNQVLVFSGDPGENRVVEVPNYDKRRDKESLLIVEGGKFAVRGELVRSDISDPGITIWGPRLRLAGA